MKTRGLEVPELDFGWVEQATDSIVLGLREKHGIYACVHPKFKASAAYWAATGYNVSDNSANDGAPESARKIPFNKSCCFVGADVLAQGQLQSGPIPIAQWGLANYNQNGSWIAMYRPYLIKTNSVSEDYTGNGMIYSGDNPEQFYQWHLAVGKACRLATPSSRWLDDYAGSIFVAIKTPQQRANVRAAMLNKATALSSLQQGGPLNHRNHPGWARASAGRPQLWDWVDPVIQSYWIFGSADLDPYSEIVKFICNAIVLRNALDELGNTTAWPTQFGWDSSTQVAGDGFGVKRYRTTPNGGTVETDRFPTYPFAMALALRVYAITHKCRILYAWEDNNWYSKNPANTPVNSGSPGNLLTQYTGPATTQYQTQVLNYDSPGETSFPGQPFTNEDARTIALKWGEQMGDWSGLDFTPYQIREKGQSAYSATTMDAALTGYETAGIYCQGATKVAGQWSLTIFNMGATAKHVEVPLGGGVWKSEEQNEDGAKLAPGVLYCFLVDGNA